MVLKWSTPVNRAWLLLGLLWSTQAEAALPRSFRIMQSGALPIDIAREELISITICPIVGDAELTTYQDSFYNQGMVAMHFTDGSKLEFAYDYKGYQPLPPPQGPFNPLWDRTVFLVAFERIFGGNMEGCKIHTP